MEQVDEILLQQLQIAMSRVTLFCLLPCFEPITSSIGLQYLILKLVCCLSDLWTPPWFTTTANIGQPCSQCGASNGSNARITYVFLRMVGRKFQMGIEKYDFAKLLAILEFQAVQMQMHQTRILYY